MRAMVLIKADKNTEAGAMLLADMGKYNEALAKAGVHPLEGEAERKEKP